MWLRGCVTPSGAMLRLFVTPTSPYARLARIAVFEKRLERQVGSFRS